MRVKEGGVRERSEQMRSGSNKREKRNTGKEEKRSETIVEMAEN